MAFRWQDEDGPTLNAGLIAVIVQGIRTVLLRNPIFLLFSNWGGGGGGGVRTPSLPSGSAHAVYFVYVAYQAGYSLYNLAALLRKIIFRYSEARIMY